MADKQAAPVAKPAAKWVLFNTSTGERIERWPVDARAMVACGEYTTDTPAGHIEPAATVTPSPDPVPHVTRAKQMTEAVSPTGAPLAVANSESAGPAQPVALPTGRRSVKKG